LITELLVTPIGAGETAALAAVVKPRARVVPIRKVRIILFLLLQRFYRTGRKIGGKLPFGR
jgi:hypothetical protein